MEKCGFEREGVKRFSAFKDGELADEISYALVHIDGSSNSPIS